MKYRRFFPELSDLFNYVKHTPNIIKWRYQFTFSYGYELIVEEVSTC